MEDIVKDISYYIRARYPLLYIISPEERRVEKSLSDIASQLSKRLFTWTSTKGFIDAKTESTWGNSQDLIMALDSIQGAKEEV